MPNGKERTILCESCGVEVVTKYSRTRFCPECSARRNMESILRSQERQRKKRMDKPEDDEFYLHYCDSQEKIQLCLNCPQKECTNCLANGAMPSSSGRRKIVYFEDIRDELITAVKKGLAVSAITQKLGCADMSVRRWIKRLEKEGVL